MEEEKETSASRIGSESIGSTNRGLVILIVEHFILNGLFDRSNKNGESKS